MKNARQTFYPGSAGIHATQRKGAARRPPKPEDGGLQVLSGGATGSLGVQREACFFQNQDKMDRNKENR